MLVVGRRLFPWLLWQVARTGSRELFTLCVIAAALGIAYGSSALFGASFALGAFFAGMVLRESDLSYRAAQESLPLRDAFSVLFFVSVGMLFDPAVVLTRPLQVLAVVAVILVGKSLAAFLLVVAFRYPLNTALTVSASLAQIGEFSFILAGLGVALGLLPVEGQNFILAGAIISIALNPIVFQTIEPVERWLKGGAVSPAGSNAGRIRWRPCRPRRRRTTPRVTCLPGAADDRSGMCAQSGDRNGRPNAQRGGSRAAPQGECRQGLHGGARARRRHDASRARASRTGLRLR
jgi:monovalent cation:H+ antiporter-2, CPA2 family